MNKNKELINYYNRAKDILNYDPCTGVFTKLIKSRGSHKEVGYVSPKGYRMISISVDGISKGVRSHRLAWFVYYGEMPNIIDHINGVRYDNRIINLRSCNNQQNSFNKSLNSNNTSGFKGVYYNKKSERWQSSIKINGKLNHIGCFSTSEEASKAYKEKAKEMHGEFYRE